MGEDIDEIMKTLKKYSQEHLLNRYSELDQAKQKVRGQERS